MDEVRTHERLEPMKIMTQHQDGRKMRAPRAVLTRATCACRGLRPCSCWCTWCHDCCPHCSSYCRCCRCSSRSHFCRDFLYEEMYSLHPPLVTIDCVDCYRYNHDKLCTKFFLRFMPQMNSWFTDCTGFPVRSVFTPSLW